jgi:hypothetical protein
LIQQISLISMDSAESTVDRTSISPECISSSLESSLSRFNHDRHRRYHSMTQSSLITVNIGALFIYIHPSR